MDKILTEKMMKMAVEKAMKTAIRKVSDHYIIPVHPIQARWIKYNWDYSKPKRRKQFEKAWKMTYK